jgi:pilus assembly protein CpaD
MSLPESSANPQLAVAAVAEARAIAYENGVQYEEIEGTHHGEGSLVSEPMILAFQSFEAIAPDCPSLATIDFADISSNNERSTLGCAVRSNLAAMIADPADLLGTRPLDKADPLRQSVILEKFRQGESTASTRTNQESGTVSQAISN